MATAKTPPAGRWQQPHLAPRGTLVWTDRHGIASAAQIAGTSRCVATVHRVAMHWNLRIEGWLWTVTEDMAIARFNKIPGDKIKETPVKRFRKLEDAVREVELIITPKEG